MIGEGGGGVLTYIRNSIPYHRLSILECDEVESLWLLMRDKCMPRNFSHILVGVIYHPPGACDLITINHTITSIDDTIKKYSHTGVMLLGDFNNLNDTQLRSYPPRQVVRLPTRRAAILDKIFLTLTPCTIRQKSLLHRVFLITILLFTSRPLHLDLTQVQPLTSISVSVTQKRKKTFSMP